MKNKSKNPKPSVVNWFSEDNRKKSKPSLAFSFLGNSTKKKESSYSTPKINKTINFLGTNKSSTMKPSSLFRKESINGKKKLTKWGDADMDGTPNYFDCDPLKANKDKKSPKGEYIKKLSKQKEYSAEDLQAIAVLQNNERIRKKEEEKYRLSQAEKKARGERKGFRETLFEGFSKSLAPLPTRRDLGLETVSKEKERKAIKELKKEEKKLTNATYLTAEEKEKRRDKIEKAKEKMTSQQDKTKSLEKESAKMLAMLEGKGAGGKVKYNEYLIERQIAAGKAPTKKMITALYKARAKTAWTGPEGKLEKIRRVMPGGTAVGVLTGAGVTREGTYTKEVRAKAARAKRYVQTGVGQLFGAALTQTRFNSEPVGRGRPAGPSGEYRIGGKPVYEAEYQEYAAKQRALNRMLPSEAQTQSLNPEYLDYMKKQAESESQPQQPSETNQYAMEQSPEQIEDPNSETGYTPRTEPTIEEIKDAQHMAQQKDNILMAPNFSKGQLKNTGSNVLTPTGPQILDAPQVFKGEMRNVRNKKNMPAVTLSERPQTNPYSDTYLEIEIGSGKPKIKRRITEKFMTGEAL